MSLAKVYERLERRQGDRTVQPQAEDHSGGHHDDVHHHEDGGHRTQGSRLPWPTSLDGLGSKRLGSFQGCLWCKKGTWTRYGGLPTCLSCARDWPETRTPDGAKAYLWRLLDLWSSMDESTWQEANVKALYEDILDIFKANPQADAWLSAWRLVHPEVRRNFNAA